MATPHVYNRRKTDGVSVSVIRGSFMQGELAMKKQSIKNLALVVAMGLVGCGVAPDLGSTDQNVVSTDLSAYTAGQNIVVTYSAMSGAKSDWIAIAHPSDPATSYEAWQYTGGGTSGTMTFTAPALGSGTYEARAFYDWYGTASYTIQQRSASFTFSGGAASPTLAATQSSYAFGASVPINYSGFSGSTTDWIAIYVPGAADGNYVAWQYTGAEGAGNSGQLVFTGLATGTYEARYHADWNGTHSFATFAVSPQFTIGTQTSITTDHTTYGTNQSITATYSNMPGAAGEYVAVSVAGSPASSTIQQFPTNGQMNGSQVFSPLAMGSYEARAYNASNAIIASSTFTVGGTGVTTDKSSYAAGDAVTVTYTGMPGNAQDWIGISVAGSGAASYVQYQYTGGAMSGTAVFTGLPTGTYEARAYYNNSYTVSARSAPFVVGQSCVVGTKPVLSTLVSGDIVLDANTRETTAALTAPLTTSILFMSVNEAEPSPMYGDVYCELVATGVHCKRDQAGTDTGNGTVTIHYTVATFSSGVTVQRGTVDTNVTNPAQIPITAVDPTTSFVLVGGGATAGGGWGTNEFTRATLQGASTLEIAQSAQGSFVAWQVVTMAGASVTRGTTSLATTDTQSVVTVPNTPSGSLLLASYESDNAGSIAAASLMLQSSISSPTTLTFQRGLGGSNMSVSWELVAMPFAVHSGVASFAAGVATTSVPVTGISGASSVGISSTQAILGQSGGSTTYAGAANDLVGEAAFSMVTGSGTLSLTRLSSTASATLPWNVVDFAHDCAGN